MKCLRNKKTGDIISDDYGILNEYLDEYGLMDEIINFDELKNDELVRLKCVSKDAKLEEILKILTEYFFNKVYGSSMS